MQELALLWVQRERADAAPPRQTARGILQDKPLLAPGVAACDVLVGGGRHGGPFGAPTKLELFHIHRHVADTPLRQRLLLAVQRADA